MIYFNDEGKVRLNLSNHAHSVMESDMLSFQVAEKAAFLNRIIQNFHGKAQASFGTNILAQKEEEWKFVLEKIRDLRQCLDLEKMKRKGLDPGGYSDPAILSSLECDYLERLASSMPKPEKGFSFTFRINNHNRETLERSKELEKGIYEAPQDYIKALIEEYACLPYYSREEVYYRDIIDDIQMYIDAGKLIEIRKGAPEGRGAVKKAARENAIQLAPYRIMPDKARNYHYIIGARIQNGRKTYLSLRISDITGVRKIHSLSSEEKLTKQEKDELKTLLEDKGAAFIGMPSAYSIVKLTAKGVNMYRKMLFLRPAYVKVCNRNEYLFDCTMSQLEFYFFKFGKEASVIGPSGIRGRFRKSYGKASDAYNEMPCLDDEAFKEKVKQMLDS